MAINLSFAHLTRYDKNKDGIVIDVTMRHAGSVTLFEAKLDTAATYCIFDRILGENIGIQIEEGMPQRIGTATGTFISFGHEVVIETLNLQFETYVFFAATEGFSKNVLGRRGWLDLLKVGLIDYDGELYLDRYQR